MWSDPARESVQLRFVGQVSSLLLVWPAKNEGEALLRYPTFACASSKGWGKTTRGVGASWSFSDSQSRRWLSSFCFTSPCTDLAPSFRLFAAPSAFIGPFSSGFIAFHG